MPEAAFHHRALTLASHEVVWVRLQDPAVWATVAGVDTTSDHAHCDDLLTEFRFTTSIAGVPYRGTARVTEARHHETMTLAVQTNEVLGAIVVALTAGDPGTALDVALRMRPAGIMGSMIFPVVAAAVREGFSESVDRFAAEMA